MSENELHSALTSGSAPSPTPWHHHYDEGVPALVDVFAQPLYHLLDEAATHYPHHKALIFQNTSLTYQQLQHKAETFAPASTDARIVDMEGGSLTWPPGKLGELIVRGPQVKQGYWNRPDETASALRNGWLYTDDLVTMDEQGYFHSMERKKDMVIVGKVLRRALRAEDDAHRHGAEADSDAPLDTGQEAEVMDVEKHEQHNGERG